jgi:hypothetical protein
LQSLAQPGGWSIGKSTSNGSGYCHFNRVPAAVRTMVLRPAAP